MHLVILKETAGLALVYSSGRTENFIEGFSDASFAPQGNRSVGCSLTRYLEQPVAWRAGRQALVSLSVAEAELIETINTTQMAHGTSAIMEELHQIPAEIVIKVGNAAAVGLSNEAGGSWKTRYLKVRAYHLREAVRLRELRIEYIPEIKQLGDLGTKAFSRPRLQELLVLWGLKSPTDPGTTDQEEHGVVSPASNVEATRKQRLSYVRFPHSTLGFLINLPLHLQLKISRLRFGSGSLKSKVEVKGFLLRMQDLQLGICAWGNGFSGFKQFMVIFSLPWHRSFQKP